jgi:hypothetical protein
MSKPSNKILWDMENEAYEKIPKKNIDEFSLFSKYTDGIKIYIKNKDIVVAIRGSADMADVKADIRIVNGSLYKSKRYQEDKRFLEYIHKIFPRNQGYKYYFVGHSLGGAIADQMIEDGLLDSGISYNPAVEMKYRNNDNNYRIYNEDDLLYNLMGRFTKNHEVRKNKLSLTQKLLNKIPLGFLGNSIKAHLLKNFQGGKIHYYLYLE